MCDYEGDYGDYERDDDIDWDYDEEEIESIPSDNSVGSCRFCKHLVRYKVEGDIHWHYRCDYSPDDLKFDTWESLTYGRTYSICGYERIVIEDKITPWDERVDFFKYPFKKGWRK